MVAADYNFSLTRTKLIEGALRKIGALSEGEVMSAYQEAGAVDALNLIVKSWQTKGVFLWSETLHLITTSIADNTYDFPTTDPTFLSIDKAFIREDGDDLPMEIKSWRDYQDICEKDNTGKPFYLSVDRRNNTIYLYPTPDAVYSIYVLGVNKLKDYDTDSSTGDIPPEWLRALSFQLAYDLTFEYPVPPNERQSLKGEAEQSFMEAKNTEGSKSSSDLRFVESAFPVARGR